MSLDFNVKMMKSLKAILFCGFLFLPLIFWPRSAIPFEMPKVTLVYFVSELSGLFLVLILIFGKLRINRVERKIIWSSTLFIAGVFISSFLGVDFSKSFWGNYYRRDGIVTLLHLWLFFNVVALVWKNEMEAIVVRGIFFGSLGVSLWAVGVGINYYLFNKISIYIWNGEVGVSFGQPNFLAGYTLICLPFTYYLYKAAESKRWKCFLVLAAAAQVMTIVFTRSLGAILVLIVSGTVLMVYLLRKKIGLWLRLALWGLILMLILALGFYRFRTERFVAEGRERIIVKLLLSTAERPVTGWGWANVDYAFEKSTYPIIYMHDVYVDKAHSSLLEALVTLGVVGLVIYINFLWSVGIRLLNLLSREKGRLFNLTLVMVFFVYVLYAQTNVTSISGEFIFWLIAGIASARI